ncbi:MAG: hypothetical protein GWP19_14255, partial [Planctomycetia bacterium]|nr:hypothetical protein [Planctomycetia bacterium]
MKNINSQPETSSAESEFYFQWHINERCNLRCAHCYQEEYNKTPELTLSHLKKTADQIFLALNKWGKRGRIAIT